MKIKTLSKVLNETEIGKMGTNETYVSVLKDIDSSSWFPTEGEEVSYYCKSTKKNYTPRINKAGSENRINGLGIFYRDVNMLAGDRVVFKSIQVKENEPEYLISKEKSEAKTLLHFYGKLGYRLLNSEYPNEIFELNKNYKITINGNKSDLVFKYKGLHKPRADSKNELEFYDIQINGKPMVNEWSRHSIIECYLNNNVIKLIEQPYWHLHSLTLSKGD